MGKRVYENGYAGKIAYHTNKLNEATAKNDAAGMEKAHKDLTYFVRKQFSVAVENSINGKKKRLK